MVIRKECDFYDIRENAWGGATFTLDTIEEKGKEQEFMDLLDELYPEGADETELNDFIAFEDGYIFESLGISDDDEGDEEDEEE